MKRIAFLILFSVLNACTSDSRNLPSSVEAQEERFRTPADYDYGPAYEGDGDYLDDNPYAYWY